MIKIGETSLIFFFWVMSGIYLSKWVISHDNFYEMTKSDDIFFGTWVTKN